MSVTVGLFVTCLVDVQRPSIAFASIQLLEQAGCHVEVPEQQTCCGQPAYNNGDESSAIKIAKQVIEAFEAFDYCVAPSGSCLGMIKHHYPQLFKEGLDWHQRAIALANKSFELSSFLVDELKYVDFNSSLNNQIKNTQITYHDSCSGLRELKILNQPRKLLAQVVGLELIELEDNEVCCGFGGTFSVKFSDISGQLVDQKCQQISATKASIIAAGDLGCLLNISGRLQRIKSDIKVFHWAEIVAGLTEQGGI